MFRRAAMVGAGAKALILGSSVEGSPSLEQQKAQAEGFAVTVVTNAQWEAMTTAQFEQYQVIIIGDPGQANTGSSSAVGNGSVALQTVSTWAPAVQNTGGNKFVFVSSPVFSYNYTHPTPNSLPVIADGIAYAGAVSGATGVYLDIGDSYQTENWNSSLPLMAGLSSYPSSDWKFASSDAVGGDGNTVNLIGSTPQTTDLSDSLLDNWWPSWEGVFQAFPPDYHPLALVPNAGASSGYAQTCGTDVSTGSSVCGLPFMLVSGQNVSPGTPSFQEQAGAPAIGEAPSTCQNGPFPVNCASGVFWHTFQDASVPGNGMALDFTRTYSSLDASTNGPLGYGWTDSYDMSLNVTSGVATVTESNGSEVPFYPNGSGGYTAPSRVLATLVKNSDGSYTYMRYGDHVKYVFSSSGQLVSETDRNGYTTTLSYTNGQLSSVTDAAGRSLSISYNGSLISSVSEPGGNSWSYSYDGSGNLSSVTGPGNRTWNYTYDSGHLMQTMVDPDNGTVTNTYNSSAQIIKQVDPAQHTTTYSYSGNPATSAGSTTTITDGAGNVTVQSYQNLQLQSVTRGSGTSQAATTYYQYDPTGRVSQVKDPDGNATNYTYDAHGNLLSVTDPLGDKTSYGTYNSFDEPSSVTDPMNTTTSYSYDANGNLLSKSTPDVQTGQTQTWSYAYTDLALPGDPTQITDPDNNTTQLGYDPAGNLTSVTDAAGNQTTYTYDGLGERTSMVSPAGNVPGGSPASYTTTYGYDVPFELSSVTDPLNHSTGYVHNGDGALSSVTDANQNETTYTLDGDNEVTQVNRPDSTTTKTSYNADGTIHTQTDGNGNVTTYGYDSLARVSSVSDPKSRQTTYGYNGDGDLTSLQDPQNRTTTYVYDAGNELKSISYSDGTTPNVSYGYNADGERTSMSDGTGSTSYVYDSLGRLTSSTDGSGDTTGYGYDLASNQTSITYPNGKQVTRKFDSAERLQSVTDWLGNTTGFGYDPDSNLQSTTYPSGTSNVDSYGYNNADQLTSVGMNQGSTSLASLSYGRDPAGQVSSEAQTGLPGQASTSYTYNSLEQLTGTGSQGYAYDSAGNPTTLSGNGGYTYDNANQLTGAPASASPDQTSPAATSYGYDQLGERTSSTLQGGLPSSYTYDQAGRLIKSTPASYTVGLGAGAFFSAALQSNGTVLAWGGQPRGELGIGSTTTTATPSEVHNLTGVTALSTSYANSLALKADGSVWAWGWNQYGNLGDGTTTNRTTPVKVSGLPTIKAVTMGVYDGYALDANGNVWAWGDETDGELGNGISGSGNYSATAIEVPNLTGVSEVEASWGTAIALKSDGTVWTWGLGTYGELGTGQTLSATPAQVPGLSNIKQVAEINQTSYALDSSGHVWVWGAGQYGELGDGTTNSSQTTPEQISGLSNVTKLVSGVGWHMVAQESDGSLWEWGLNNEGQLGDGSTTNHLTPEKVAGITNPVALANGYAHTLALTSPTNLEAWGYNTAYELGNGTTTNASTPTTATLYHATPAAPASTYAYNGDGLRMSKTVSGTTSQFAWNNTGSLPQLLTDGTNSYIYGPDGIPIEQITLSGTVSYLHHDQLGSIRLITNSTGNTVGTTTYGAYGAVQGTTGSVTSPFGYAGQYTDPETGLQYDQARYYDPTTGQFLSGDPLEAVTGEPYSYANGNPINGTDPTGLDCGITDPGGCINQVAGTDVGADAGNFAAGAASAATFGLSTQLLNQVGINPDACSSAYQTGATAGPYAAMMIPWIGEGDALVGAAEVGSQYTEDQQALQQLVNEATNGGRKPLSAVDAQTVGEWAKETGYPGARASAADVSSPSNWDANPVPHVHLPGVGRGGHIPVEPGSLPW